MLNTTKAFMEFGFRVKARFEEGLKKSIEWYKKPLGSKIEKKRFGQQPAKS